MHFQICSFKTLGDALLQNPKNVVLSRIIRAKIKLMGRILNFKFHQVFFSKSLVSSSTCLTVATKMNKQLAANIEEKFILLFDRHMYLQI